MGYRYLAYGLQISISQPNSGIPRPLRILSITAILPGIILSVFLADLIFSFHVNDDDELGARVGQPAVSSELFIVGV